MIVTVEKSAPATDIIERSIGTLGRWHIWVCIIIFLVKFPVAWHQLSIVILAAPTNFECADNYTDKCDKNCSQHVFDKSVFTETIQSEWDLVCEKTQLANLAQTITMLGILFGSMIFGVLSDRFGRRGPLVWAVVIQVVTGTAAAFASWFWLFLVMRFLSAAATGGTMVTSFVLVMELIGTEKRTAVGVIYQIPFNLGHLLLAVFGYFIRDWRIFQMAISLPSAILISYYWIMPESPRWLLTAGRTDEAIKILEKAAKTNQLPTANIRDEVTGFYAQKKLETDHQQKGNMMDLVRTPNMLNKTVCMCFNWIVCGICFFGVAQFMGQLGGDIFLNVALSAAVQIPGTFISIWTMNTWGRRNTLMASNALTGAACILIAFIPANPIWPRVLLGCVGMLGMSIAFPTVYIFAGELFPTVIRNIGVGASSMCARIGSMIAPFAAGLSVVQPWIPPLIFGIIPLLGALLCLRLPETLNCELPDTLEEAERFGKKEKKIVSNGISKDETEMHI